MIRWDGKKLYFTSEDGITYRVYELLDKRGGGFWGKNPPIAQAQDRAFVRADGTRLVVGVGFTERGNVTEEILERQLKRALGGSQK